MKLVITKDDPQSADGRLLIDQSEVFMRANFPPEECFTYSPEELANAQTWFYIARLNGQPIGCVALVLCVGYGEIKRLFVADNGRGLGLGRKLMQNLEDDAQEGGISLLRLETGHDLKEAVGLYRSLGYRACTSYGDYGDAPNSLFLEKRLG